MKEIYRVGMNYSAPHEYSTREVLINTNHIVQVTENREIAKKLEEGSVRGVDKQLCCTLILSSGSYTQEMTVAGGFSELHKHISGRKLLNG